MKQLTQNDINDYSTDPEYVLAALSAKEHLLYSAMPIINFHNDYQLLKKLSNITIENSNPLINLEDKLNDLQVPLSLKCPLVNSYRILLLRYQLQKGNIDHETYIKMLKVAIASKIDVKAKFYAVHFKFQDLGYMTLTHALTSNNDTPLIISNIKSDAIGYPRSIALPRIFLSNDTPQIYGDLNLLLGEVNPTNISDLLLEGTEDLLNFNAPPLHHTIGWHDTINSLTLIDRIEEMDPSYQTSIFNHINTSRDGSLTMGRSATPLILAIQAGENVIANRLVDNHNVDKDLSVFELHPAEWAYSLGHVNTGLKIIIKSNLKPEEKRKLFLRCNDLLKIDAYEFLYTVNNPQFKAIKIAMEAFHWNSHDKIIDTLNTRKQLWLPNFTITAKRELINRIVNTKINNSQLSNIQRRSLKIFIEKSNYDSLTKLELGTQIIEFLVKNSNVFFKTYRGQMMFPGQKLELRSWLVDPTKSPPRTLIGVINDDTYLLNEFIEHQSPLKATYTEVDAIKLFGGENRCAYCICGGKVGTKVLANTLNSLKENNHLWDATSLTLNQFLVIFSDKVKDMSQDMIHRNEEKIKQLFIKDIYKLCPNKSNQKSGVFKNCVKSSSINPAVQKKSSLQPPISDRANVKPSIYPRRNI